MKGADLKAAMGVVFLINLGGFSSSHFEGTVLRDLSRVKNSANQWISR
jgi:hypothetical protein